MSWLKIPKMNTVSNLIEESMQIIQTGFWEE